MKKRKPKTVAAWGFAVMCPNGKPLVQLSNGKRKDMPYMLRYWTNLGATCGPIVRVEVPAPKERSK